MPFAQDQLRKLHAAKIIEITDATSRFSFKVECPCGVQGHFYTREEAELYLDFHFKRQGVKVA